jgi:hypothetical protein
MDVPMTSHESADRGLELRLLRYAVAAGLALASQVRAHGQVIFTPSSAAFHGIGNKLDIDLDNDGSTDFSLIAKWTYYDTGNMIQALFASGDRPSHQILTDQHDYAAALTKGTRIGPGQNFRAFALMETPFYRGSWGYWGGYGKNRCLGVRFLIHGEVHYGWIGFRGVRSFPVSAKLYGYAYETTPGKGIVAGDTGTSATLDSSISPTSLEILAAGHTAIDERHKRTSGGSVN